MTNIVYRNVPLFDESRHLHGFRLLVWALYYMVHLLLSMQVSIYLFHDHVLCVLLELCNIRFWWQYICMICSFVIVTNFPVWAGIICVGGVCTFYTTLVSIPICLSMPIPQYEDIQILCHGCWHTTWYSTWYVTCGT